ncbi:MAG: hypothetical protein GAK45_00129 [Pseudomonas citronellolis]|nr:MAG: hypothetical protein GAK45_00129 [Pseudomonas citronellolis]
MSRFLTTLRTEQQGKWGHLLLNDLVLEDELGTFSTPAGFETDFASIKALRNVAVTCAYIMLAMAVLPLTPTWLRIAVLVIGMGALVLYALCAGYGNLGATIHDQLYTIAQLPRRDCDAVFYRALRAEGVARWRAWIMYAGVRLGGASHYGTV